MFTTSGGRSGPRRETILAWGSFTLAAAATLVVANANVRPTSIVLLVPTNASAGALQAGATHLYISTKVAGTSFTVATANAGAAAGGETFDYVIVN